VPVRVAEERGVVEGDDAATTAQQRHRVVRRVDDVDAEAAGQEREAELLPGEADGGAPESGGGAVDDRVGGVSLEPVGLRSGLHHDVQLDAAGAERFDESGDVATDTAEVVGDRRRIDQGADVSGQKVEGAPARIAI
jgi:hypothetical protein